MHLLSVYSTLTVNQGTECKVHAHGWAAARVRKAEASRLCFAVGSFCLLVRGPVRVCTSPVESPAFIASSRLLFLPSFLDRYHMRHARVVQPSAIRSQEETCAQRTQRGTREKASVNLSRYVQKSWRNKRGHRAACGYLLDLCLANR